MVKVETKGIPKERDQAIYRSIIDTKAKFLTYLSFVLAENPAAAVSEAELTDGLSLPGEGSEGEAPALYAVYEKMLRVFHQNPRRLKGIADMIRRLDPEIVGEEFLQMYGQFEAAAKKVRI